MTEYMTAAAWAATAGVSERTARRYCDKGRLPGARLGPDGFWQIPTDTPAPDTRPGHMRQAPRVIPGQLVTPTPTPAAPARYTPERGGVAARHTPEIPGFLFVNLDDLAAMAGPRVSRKQLAAMLAAGEIKGTKRGPGHGWIITRAEVLRIAGIIT